MFKISKDRPNDTFHCFVWLLKTVVPNITFVALFLDKRNNKQLLASLSYELCFLPTTHIYFTKKDTFDSFLNQFKKYVVGLDFSTLPELCYWTLEAKYVDDEIPKLYLFFLFLHILSNSFSHNTFDLIKVWNSELREFGQFFDNP